MSEEATTGGIAVVELVERARHILLGRYAPPSLLVSSSHALLHSTGGASQYFTRAPTSPNPQLFDLVRGELKDALAGTLERVQERDAPLEVRLESVTAERAGTTVRLAVTASRIAPDAFLVTLEPQISNEADLVATLERQRLEMAQQREHFLAMLSHELRNPLAAIGSAADIIEGWRDPALQRAAGVLARQTQHLKGLLDDLLDANRMALDRLLIEKRPVGLSEVVAYSVEAVESTARALGVEIIAAEVPEVILEGDPSRLQQMLTNLLMNAVKFSERGDRARLEFAERGTSMVIQVIDEGVGIAAKDIEHVFELFYQDAQDLDRTRGGLGVGLSLARTIAEAHGGTLRASSDGRGMGSCFEVVLPKSSKEEGVAAAEAVLHEHSRDDQLTVVVVEDQQDNRDMLSMLITMRGHRTVGIAEGEEAVATILAAQPHLALIDIGLPGIDGYEVARRLRALEQGASLYLVALTGYGRPEDRERARRAGFDEHVVKPLAREELDRLLMHAAARRGPESV